MAVTAHKEPLKIRVKLVKGSVNVSKIDPNATDANIIKFGNAVVALCAEEKDVITKVETFSLVQGV